MSFSVRVGLVVPGSVGMTTDSEAARRRHPADTTILLHGNIHVAPPCCVLRFRETVSPHDSRQLHGTAAGSLTAVHGGGLQR